ncbi:MAG: HupE/UreJ family protein [Chitinophagaceae bacterium]|nr:MAG: HupE/UreJ family protein [Chitinophagaceae bacterium]
MQEFLFYFRMGWEHIISTGALDHQLFILALCAIYTLRDWKQVLVLVTAFTIGHSLTLALSVKDWIVVPSAIIEFLIPCTIVVTAIFNLFQKKFTPKSIRINYFLALFFGLIHGMGFANAVRMMLASGESFGMGLFGFNLGLEAGQIVVVALVLLVAKLFLDGFRTSRREWVVFLSGAVFAISLMMALERIP